MLRKYLVLAAMVAVLCVNGLAQGPYTVLKTVKVGGEGGFDYVSADSDARRLYVARSGATGRVSVYNLDTLELVGEVPATNGHGVAFDPKTNHAFVTSKPVVMFDTRTVQALKSIDVQGGPDGILFDPFNQRVYDFSHSAPNATVISSVDGSVVGTIDLGGAPEQAVTDLNGHLYVDIEDKDKVAQVDVKTMAVTKTYDLGDAKTPAGLAFDAKNHILFVACRMPTGTMVILNSDTGKIITTLPLGAGTDGATFNPATMEAFSSQGDGTLTVIKENSPTSFAVEQTVTTPVRAKTLTLDTKTNQIVLITAEFTPAPAGGRGQVLTPGSFQIVVVGK